MNKLSPKADKGWSSSLGVECGAENTLQYKTTWKNNFTLRLSLLFLFCLIRCPCFERVRVSVSSRLPLFLGFSDSTVFMVTMDLLECRQNQDTCGFHGYQVAMVKITFVCEWCHNLFVNGYGRVWWRTSALIWYVPSHMMRLFVRRS